MKLKCSQRFPEVASWRSPRVGRLRSNGNELEVSSGCSENTVQGLCNGGAEDGQLDGPEPTCQGQGLRSITFEAPKMAIKGRDYEVSLLKRPCWPPAARKNVTGKPTEGLRSITFEAPMFAVCAPGAHSPSLLLIYFLSSSTGIMQKTKVLGTT